MCPEKQPNCRPIPFKAVKAVIYYNHKQIKLYPVKGSLAILCELDEICKQYGWQSQINMMVEHNFLDW